jgi:hypothetical protein
MLSLYSRRNRPATWNRIQGRGGSLRGDIQEDLEDITDYPAGHRLGCFGGHAPMVCKGFEEIEK